MTVRCERLSRCRGDAGDAKCCREPDVYNILIYSCLLCVVRRWCNFFAKKTIFFVEKLARFGNLPYICTRNQGMAP